MDAVTRSDQTQVVAHGGKYLTFGLADEEYGLDTQKVREIIGILDIAAVPQVPSYVKGAINLRGKVIPVIDLRLKLGLEPAGYTDETCIIVVDAGTPTGVIVDSVQEVVDIAGSQIGPPPSVGAAADNGFVVGLGKVRDDVKMLLDIDKVLTTEELEQLEESLNSR